LTAFANNTVGGQLPELELRHRRRARAEDRIDAAKTTGLTNLPLHGFAHNRIWVALVGLALEMTAGRKVLRVIRMIASVGCTNVGSGTVSRLISPDHATAPLWASPE
jgi:hypothetical protein